MWLRALFALGLLFATVAQAADSLSPTPVQHWFNTDGTVCVGCKLFTYQAATSTKLNVYTDSGGGTAYSNPIILNARGEPPSSGIWLPAASSYKFVLAPASDTDPPTNPIWTVDQITNGTIGTLGIGAGLASSGGNLIICNTCVTNAMLAATTGAGSVVLATGPTIVSPTIGGTVVASGAIPNAALVNNKVTIGSTDVALGNTVTTFAGVTLTAPTTNNGTFNSPTLVTPALGTPASGNIASTTGYALANLTGAGTGVLTFLATPSSANLATAVTDETGSGALVFGTAPNLGNPTLNTLSASNGNTGLCYVTAGGAIVTATSTCTNPSDARFKTNFAVAPGLDAVMRLKPVEFDWRDNRQSRSMGFRAQDLAEVFPGSAVVEDTGDVSLKLPDGTVETVPHALGIHSDQLIAPLVRSIQEMEAQIVELRIEVRRLKATNASLRR